MNNEYSIMKKRNLILDKSFEFSLKIIEIYKELIYKKKEYVMSKQLLRSATSIGANCVSPCEIMLRIKIFDFI